MQHFLAWAWPIAAFSGIVVDFLIGRSGQERVRNFLVAWWIRFDDVKWNNFTRKEAEFSVQSLDQLWGNNFLSIKRLRFISVLFTVTFFAGYLTTLFVHWPPNF